ncbi:MAG: hypothetical protein ACD_4C00125G0002 [uncultured bacterium (gcode 4)]|uniref:Uncharacterized protein n=1 Tax=uncultured bacterium (gcode 4) TaxID=1234023 RepID=K2G9Q6_9BACT|nr:MAG: hypothetical protein ACD_4C00125G0002 [uncultured bacterium (gcode 4)]
MKNNIFCSEWWILISPYIAVSILSETVKNEVNKQAIAILQEQIDFADKESAKWTDLRLVFVPLEVCKMLLPEKMKNI